MMRKVWAFILTMILLVGLVSTSLAYGERTEPYFAYSACTFTYQPYSWEAKKTITLTLLDMKLGAEANAIVANENMFNDVPASDEQWLFFKFKIKYVSGPEEELQASDIIYNNQFSSGFYATQAGVSLKPLSTATLSNVYEGMDVWDITLYPGNEAVCYAGVLIKKSAGYPLFKIPNTPDTYIWFNTDVKYPRVSSASYNSIKINWKSIPGVGGYEIYYATSKTGTYSKLAKLYSGTTFTKTGLVTGKKYYFKLRVFTSGRYSAFSLPASGTPIPATPTSIKAVNASRISIRIAWGAVSGATKYEVYRATSSKGTYSLIGTASGTSLVNTGLTTGKTYYYKVRAYHLEGSTKIYSKFSSVVYAKPEQIIQDAAWSWWCEPKAVRYKGDNDKLYLTWVDKVGAQWVGSYNYKTQEIDKFQLYSSYRADDHNAPAIVPPRLGMQDTDPFIVFYTGHNNDNVMRYRKTTVAEDIASLGPEKTIEFTSAITYAQVYRYENTIIIFTRTHSLDGKWAIRLSQDGGDTWAEEKLFFLGGTNSYAYLATQKPNPNSDVINIVAGDIPAGPYTEPENTTQKIHACRLYLSDGRIETVDGATIANIYTNTDLPIKPANMTLVYVPETNENTRLFGVSSGDLNHMEIFFMGFKDWEGKSDGIYKYAIWDGAQFVTRELCPTGTIIDDKSYFAGGDIGNTGVVCLAREENGEWIVELWKTEDLGVNWTVSELSRTTNPIKSYRPMDIYNCTAGSLPDLSFIWVQGTFTNFHAYDTNLIMFDIK